MIDAQKCKGSGSRWAPAREGLIPSPALITWASGFWTALLRLDGRGWFYKTLSRCIQWCSLHWQPSETFPGHRHKQINSCLLRKTQLWLKQPTYQPHPLQGTSRHFNIHTWIPSYEHTCIPFCCSLHEPEYYCTKTSCKSSPSPSSGACRLLRCASHRDNNQFDGSNECGEEIGIELFKREGKKALKRDHHLILLYSIKDNEQ